MTSQTRYDYRKTEVDVDSRLPDDVVVELRDRGHDVVVREDLPVQSSFARPNGIMVDPVTGALRGGARPFGPATAIGI